MREFLQFPRETSRLACSEEAPADRNRAAVTQHAIEVIADDNAGTLRAIESTKQLKARCVTAAEWAQYISMPKAKGQSRFGRVVLQCCGECFPTRPLPPRLLIPIIARRTFSRHARRVYGTSTPPTITAY